MGWDQTQRAPTTPARPPRTCRVVRADAGGVYATPLGADTRTPFGPCLGPVPAVGQLVLLIHTDAGPWVAATHTGPLPTPEIDVDELDDPDLMEG